MAVEGQTSTQSTLVSRPTPTKEPPSKVNQGAEKFPWEGKEIDVPKDWAKMFGVRKDLNPNFVKNNFTSFIAYTTPSIAYLKTYVTGGEPYDFHTSKKIGGYNIFMPDTPLQEQFTHSYAEGTSTYDAAMNKVKETAASIMRAPVSAVSSSTMGVIYDAPRVYEKSERRKFNVDIALFAFDDLDKDIYDVIKFFRLNSYPIKVGPSTGMIQFPNVFKISGGVWDSFQAQENYYVLQDMVITYGDKVKFMKYGFPMQCSLRLTFEEILIMTQDLFDKRPVRLIVSSVMTQEETAIKTIVKQTLMPSWCPMNSTSKNIPPDLGPKASPNKVKGASDFGAPHEIVGAVEDIIKPSWGPNGAAGGYVPGGWIAPKPSPNKTEGTPPLGAQSVILKFLKDTLVARAVSNIQRIVLQQIQSKILQLLMENKYMKKFQGAFDVDPRHRVEIKSKLKSIKYAKWVV